jgi:hypothetical protein
MDHAGASFTRKLHIAEHDVHFAAGQVPAQHQHYSKQQLLPARCKAAAAQLLAAGSLARLLHAVPSRPVPDAPQNTMLRYN